MSTIFYCDGRYPKLEEIVMCDIFRNIDLREMRGTCIPVSVKFLIIWQIFFLDTFFLY